MADSIRAGGHSGVDHQGPCRWWRPADAPYPLTPLGGVKVRGTFTLQPCSSSPVGRPAACSSCFAEPELALSMEPFNSGVRTLGLSSQSSSAYRFGEDGRPYRPSLHQVQQHGYCRCCPLALFPQQTPLRGVGPTLLLRQRRKSR
jgi:hypothetical protein